MGHMKEGEEDKTKSYTALIWTQKAIDKDDITFLEETKVSVHNAIFKWHCFHIQSQWLNILVVVYFMVCVL